VILRVLLQKRRTKHSPGALRTHCWKKPIHKQLYRQAARASGGGMTRKEFCVRV
jgi:hypothetical protein